MLDGSSILLCRIQDSIQDLELAKRAIESTSVEEELRKRVGVLFVDKIDEFQKALVELRGLKDNLPENEAWQSFESIQYDCNTLLEESLSFVQGALARSAGVDFGLCRIADALLAELSHSSDIPWQRFTMLAVGEFFHDMAEIIRIRFPEGSIWNLPIACHEFGHFTEEKLTERYAGQSRNPITDVLAQEKYNDAKNVPLMRELYADLFATYALGPAYACTCLLLRFNRAKPYEDTVDHPSGAKRAYFILSALRQLNIQHIAQPYTSIIERLDNAWGFKVDEATAAQLDVWRASLYLPLSKKKSLRYDGWSQAVALVDPISAPDLSDEVIGDARKKKLSIANVLNAAWIFRIRNFDDANRVYRVGENAKRLCKEIAI
ncbi:MAG TPA: hypothetical protein VN696_01285 [Pyrinomonadaceae bacterium]|nr:hypothetical protein [Pyrinomonadaceae bacterium]